MKSPTIRNQHHLNILLNYRDNLGDEKFNELIKCYFHSDLKSVWSILIEIFQMGILQSLNKITEIICDNNKK